MLAGRCATNGCLSQTLSASLEILSFRLSLAFLNVDLTVSLATIFDEMSRFYPLNDSTSDGRAPYPATSGDTPDHDFSYKASEGLQREFSNLSYSSTQVLPNASDIPKFPGDFPILSTWADSEIDNNGDTIMADAPPEININFAPPSRGASRPDIQLAALHNPASESCT